jgi:hypothetical protein
MIDATAPRLRQAGHAPHARFAAHGPSDPLDPLSEAPRPGCSQRLPASTGKDVGIASRSFQGNGKDENSPPVPGCLEAHDLNRPREAPSGEVSRSQDVMITDVGQLQARRLFSRGPLGSPADRPPAAIAKSAFQGFSDGSVPFVVSKGPARGSDRKRTSRNGSSSLSLLQFEGRLRQEGMG